MSNEQNVLITRHHITVNINMSNFSSSVKVVIRKGVSALLHCFYLVCKIHLLACAIGQAAVRPSVRARSKGILSTNLFRSQNSIIYKQKLSEIALAVVCKKPLLAHSLGLKDEQLCSRQAKRARDDRVSCIQRWRVNK